MSTRTAEQRINSL